MLPLRRYTLGFVFDSSLSKVLLIEKNRPIEHAGYLNGLGGKFEPNETPAECVAREVWEESDLETTPNQWKTIAEVGGSDWEMYVLTYIHNGALSAAHTTTDEPVNWYEVKDLPKNIKSNLAWLIPLAIDALREPSLGIAKVKYN